MNLNLETDETSSALQPQIQMKTFRRLLAVIGGQKKLLIAGLLLIFLGTAAALSEPRLFGYAIDDAILPKDWLLLRNIGIFYLLVVCIRVSSMIAQAYLFEKLGQRVMQELRLALFAQLQALPVSTYDRNPVGRLITRVTNDISAMAEMFSAGFVTMIGNILIVIGTLVWLLVLDLRLGLIASAVFPVILITSAHFSRSLTTAYRNARTRLSALNAFLAENILGMKVVHLFNRQKIHVNRFMQINESLADAQISSVKVFAYFQPTLTWCSGIAVSLVIWFGGSRALEGSLKPGILVAFFSYVLAMFQPMREIVDKWTVFLSGMTAAERVFGILDWETEMPVAETAIEAVALSDVRGHIVFENVWFAYTTDKHGGEHWVLKDLSFEIKPGMQVGIVGHTGSGKTTLISLLLRFYEPQKGRILLDGKDLRDYDRRSLRASIGIVQQDVFLFSGSIEENLHLWKNPAPETRAKVEGAMKDLGASRHLLQLDERGSNLSTGERQILAFGRALASDPKIWIMDEATSNIDSESEERLNTALTEASKDRTLLMIAHRLATVRSADLILTLHKGVLVECGSHRELLEQNGFYSKLYRYQSVLEKEHLVEPELGTSTDL